jgi:secondary thiamine-phosphate synthase enzyme
VKSTTFTVDTGDRRFVDLTEELRGWCANESGTGLLNVFVPHATAGLVVMETGSGSERDLEEVIERLLPRDDRYAHRHGSRGHGADHLLPAFLSPSVVVPVSDGRLQLGTWQSVVLVDTNRDNPRRNVVLTLAV